MEKGKKRVQKWIVTLLIVAGLLLVTTTPSMAIRTVVLLMGHPVRAFDAQIEPTSGAEGIAENETIYVLSPAPVEQATQGELRSFSVKKYGIFHVASYYGEGY